MATIKKVDEMLSAFTCTKTSLKWVLALKGFHDDGKTSTLKTLIRLLHERDPQSWLCKFDARKVAVTGNRAEREYHAVICYKGVIVVILTGGDSPSVILGNFRSFVYHKAVVGITAVKVNADGKSETRAAVAYRKMVERLHVQECVVDIRGRKLRTEIEEIEVAERIIEELDAIVSMCK